MINPAIKKKQVKGLYTVSPKYIATKFSQYEWLEFDGKYYTDLETATSIIRSFSLYDTVDYSDEFPTKDLSFYKIDFTNESNNNLLSISGFLNEDLKNFDICDEQPIDGIWYAEVKCHNEIHFLVPNDDFKKMESVLPELEKRKEYKFQSTKDESVFINNDDTLCTVCDGFSEHFPEIETFKKIISCKYNFKTEKFECMYSDYLFIRESDVKKLIDSKAVIEIYNSSLEDLLNEFGIKIEIYFGNLFRNELVEPIIEELKKEHEPLVIKGTDKPCYFNINGKLLPSDTFNYYEFLLRYFPVQDFMLEKYDSGTPLKKANTLIDKIESCLSSYNDVNLIKDDLIHLIKDYKGEAIG